MATKHGGPAFPQNNLSPYGMGPIEGNNGGMSLRDWFAGQALAGICASPNYRDFAAAGDDVRMQTCTYTQAISRHAYQIADDMLAARDGGQ